MPPSRKPESSIIDDLFKFLSEVPVWVGPVVAAALFAGCRWLVPAVFGAASDNELSKGVLQTLSTFAVQGAPLVGGFVLVVWLAAELNKFVRRGRLEGQTGQASIDKLSWSDFESLLSEAFRRQGFAVEHTGGPRPDGGIDQRLTKAGAVTLVQCKHWKRQQVGVKVVRELLGVVTSEGAQSGIVVTSGRFTQEAIAFADRNPIRLVAGPELVKMIGKVQRSGRIAAAAAAPTTSPSRQAPRGSAARSSSSAEKPEPRAPAAVPRHASAPVAAPPAAPSPYPRPHAAAAPVLCPKCGAAMVQRTARKGANAGSAFLGCSTYPKCHGTLPL